MRFLMTLLGLTLALFTLPAAATCGSGTYWNAAAGECFGIAPASNISAAGYGGQGTGIGGTAAQEQSQGQSQAARAASGATSSSNTGPVSVGGDSSSTSVRAYALSLPPTLNVPQITPATAMCSLSESHGMAIGWNFYANTGAKQTVDGLCVAERQAAAFELQCKYKTAAAIRHWIVRKANESTSLQAVTYERPGAMYPETERTTTHVETTNLANELGQFLLSVDARPYSVERDLSVEECRRPQIVERIVHVPAPSPVIVPAPVVAPAPVVVPKRVTPKRVTPKRVRSVKPAPVRDCGCTRAKV